VSTLNLGILAHVDAGKTTLTERLLFAAGAIDAIGRVDDGNTRTDSLELERQRGITIKSAVASFSIGDLAVNLIDTPGHPDFIAEVERALDVLDGAVLVISAVEGVQAQTRILMRTLRRLRIPTLIFVNKVDRAGARRAELLRTLAEKLTPAAVPMGSVRGQGTRGARCTPFTAADAPFTASLADVLTRHDDALLTAYVDDEAAVPYRRLRAELAAQTGQSLVHPVYFGSAATGTGIDALMAGVRELLPAATGDPRGPVSGTVFKIERGPAGEKAAYVRLFTGTVRTRDRLPVRDGAEAKVTGITVVEHGADVPRPAVTAGQIGKLRGLGEVRIGDPVGLPRTGAAQPRFAPPTLETVVVPARPADRSALHGALAQLAEQDPLINLRQDDVRREVFVSLYGEVQKEVIQATLANEFGVAVTFRESTTLCVERPAGSGSAVELIAKNANPFLATVGLRIDPAPVGSGVEFRLEVELGSLPLSFVKAVEESVKETLGQGIYGWRVTDCTVTMTHSGYWARQSHAHGTFDKSMSSTAGDFRHLTPLVLMEALSRADSVVHEPVHRFRLELPADTFAPVLSLLARLDAVPLTQQAQGDSYVIEGDIPAGRVHRLEQQLPTPTRGEGVLEAAFDHYRAVRGLPPARPRTDHNPLHRKEYLLRVQRKVAGYEEG
jgi:ribosomal protection tetracycline resistance protein